MSQKQAIGNCKVRGCLYKSGVAELADALDLKSNVQRTCGFKSHRHYKGEIAKSSNATGCNPVFRRFESDFRLHKKNNGNRSLMVRHWFVAPRMAVQFCPVTLIAE